jgi:hypothetical protein
VSRCFSAFEDDQFRASLQVHQEPVVRWFAKQTPKRLREPGPSTCSVDDVAGFGLDVNDGAVTVTEVLDLTVDLVCHELLREKLLVKEVSDRSGVLFHGCGGKDLRFAAEAELDCHPLGFRLSGPIRNSVFPLRQRGCRPVLRHHEDVALKVWGAVECGDDAFCHLRERARVEFEQVLRLPRPTAAVAPPDWNTGELDATIGCRPAFDFGTAIEVFEIPRKQIRELLETTVFCTGMVPDARQGNLREGLHRKY